MSLAAMLYAIHERRARGMAKLVLILIADYVNKETGTAGPPGPSMDTLALDGGIGKGTVHRQIERLTELGLVTTEGGGSGPGHSAIYHFPRFQAQLAQQAGADDGDAAPKHPRAGRKRSRAERSGAVDNPVDNQAERSANVPLAGAHMDDPDPSSSSLTGGLLPSGESGPAGSGNGSSGSGRRSQPGQPLAARSPDDPWVRDQVRRIRTTDGDRAAAAYLAKVSQTWERAHQTSQLAQLDAAADHIGRMP